MQEIVGKKIHKWTVVGYEGKRGTERHWYKCVCDCGNESIIMRQTIVEARSKQCRNCARKEWHKNNLNPAFKHGYSTPNHPFYHVHIAWLSMKGRCYRKSDTAYPVYGGRGITVCDRWLESFENFLEDMGHPPEGYSLDRIDVNGNYEPSNCRWADSDTQFNNCQRSVYYTHNGKTLSEIQWSRKLDLPRNKFKWWAQKEGIDWVVDNVDVIKQTRVGMSDDEYMNLGLALPLNRQYA